MTTVTLYTGTTSWTVPSGCTNAMIQVWGPGTAGNDGMGGGGGGFAQANSVALTPGAVITVQIGAGNSGNPTYFSNSTYLNANSASGGGYGGAGSGTKATFHYTGGTGGFEATSGNLGSGGGGGAAGPSGNGGNGTSDASGTSPTGGAGGGTNSGTGGNGGYTTGITGTNGGQYGAGGGAGGPLPGNTWTTNGNGADGLMVITYTASSSPGFQQSFFISLG